MNLVVTLLLSLDNKGIRYGKGRIFEKTNTLSLLLAGFGMTQYEMVVLIGECIALTNGYMYKYKRTNVATISMPT